jgi:hypothetical protein
LAVGSNGLAPSKPAAALELAHVDGMNWNKPEAPPGPTTDGLPLLSQSMTERAWSTRLAGKYVATRERHRSTASPGGSVVVVTGSGGTVVVGVVVVGAATAAVVTVVGEVAAAV